MPQVLRYHVVACQQLLLENLRLTPNATSLQGERIVISVSQVRSTPGLQDNTRHPQGPSRPLPSPAERHRKEQW